MQDKTWIKLYRKIKDNPIAKDFNALGVFIWILASVDYETGEYTVSRTTLASVLNLNPNTLQSILLRLKNTYLVLNWTSTNKTTTFRVLKWSKYQNSEVSTQTKHKPNTNAYISRNKEYNHELNTNHKLNTNTIIAEKKFSPISHSRLPLEKQTPLHEVCYFLEDALGTKITNWGKQGKAYMMMLKAGYTADQIKKTITYMATQDEFFEDKGFDLMTVANQIPIYKARTRR